MARCVLFPVLLVAVAAQPLPLAGQAPARVGTASAALGTAVTEARDADAVAWNPALIGIQTADVVQERPVGSFQALGLSVGRLPGAPWLDAADRLGLLGGGPGTGGGWRQLGGILGGSARGAAADLVWLASASDGLGLFASTHTRADGDPASEGDTLTRSVTSVAGLAVARPMGRLFGRFPVRLGLTMKGRVAHVLGEGDLGERDGDSGGVYTERMIRDVPGGGLDVGAVVAIPPGARVSIAVTEIARFTLRPRQGPRTRVVYAGGDEGAWQESYGPALDGSDDPEEARAAEALYAKTVAGSWLRAGAAWDTPGGTLGWALEHRLRAGALDGAAPRSQWSASYALPRSGWPLRVAAGWGSGTRAWTVGWISRGCRVPWAVSLGRTRDHAGAPTAISVSASVGVRPGSTCTAY